MNSEVRRRILFYGISIAIHVLIFFVIAMQVGLIMPKEEDKVYEVLDFELVNPVIKAEPPPPPKIEEKPPPPPKLVDTTTELTDKEEEEQEAPPQEAQEIATPERVYEAFYKVDAKPEFKKKAALQYPIIEKRAEKEGVVILEADIDEEGILQALRVLRTAGENFDAAAIEMLRASTFSAGIKDGEAISVRMRFTVYFKLK